MINARSAAALLFAVGSAFGHPEALAGPNDQLPWMQQTFVDDGNTYTIGLQAQESPQAGIGHVNFSITGPGLWVASVHGTPSFTWEPGWAYNQAVDIGAKEVRLSAHSFTHADAPNKTIFLGPVTVDIRLERESGQVKVVIATPKADIKLQGRLVP